MSARFYTSELYVVKLGKIAYKDDSHETIHIYVEDEYKDDIYYSIALKKDNYDYFKDIFNKNRYYLFRSCSFDYLKKNMDKLFIADFEPLYKTISASIVSESELFEYRSKLNVKSANDKVLNAVLEAKSKISEELSDELKKEIIGDLFDISNRYFEYQLSLLGGEKPTQELNEEDPVVIQFLEEIKNIEQKILLCNQRSEFEAKLTL